MRFPPYSGKVLQNALLFFLTIGLASTITREIIRNKFRQRCFAQHAQKNQNLGMLVIDIKLTFRHSVKSKVSQPSIQS